MDAHTVEQLEPRYLCARPLRVPYLPAPSRPLIQDFVKPSALNTGPTTAVSAWKGSNNFKVANQVVDRQKFTGQVTVSAPGVQFTNCFFDADWDTYAVQVVGAGSVKLYSCELTHANGGGLQGNNWLAERCKFVEMGSDASDGGGNNQLLDCFITHIGMNAGAHADGFQANNGTGIVIRNTNFETPWWDESAGQVYRCNACIFLNGYVYGAKYLSGTVIDHDYFGGGNYAVYSLAQTNTSITNCVFDETEVQYGDLDGNSSVWTGNVNQDGKLI